MTISDIATIQIAATAALNLALAGFIGIFASQVWLYGSTTGWARDATMRLLPAARAAIVLTLLANMIVLWFEAASMAEVPLVVAWPAVRSVLETTHYGHLWLLGLGALVAITICTFHDWNDRHQRGAQIVAGVATALFALSRTLVSHAGADGDMAWGVVVDWIHLMLISLWVGQVLVAGLIVLRSTIGAADEDRRAGATYISFLSTSATYALVGIVMTGSFNAWHGLGSVENLLGNAYGNAFLVKLALVATAVGLGAMNRFYVMPALLRVLGRSRNVSETPQRAFVSILKWEAIMLLCVLIAAAVLSATAPPMAA